MGGGDRSNSVCWEQGSGAKLRPLDLEILEALCWVAFTVMANGRENKRIGDFLVRWIINTVVAKLREGLTWSFLGMSSNQDINQSPMCKYRGT